jgi:hypothetical protein
LYRIIRMKRKKKWELKYFFFLLLFRLIIRTNFIIMRLLWMNQIVIEK